MFNRITEVVLARPKATLAASLLVLVLAAVLGTGVFAQLKGGGFEDPGSESYFAAETLQEQFGTGAPNVVLLITAESGSVDDPAAAAAGIEITQRLAAIEAVDTDDTVSYWTIGAESLRSNDGSKALVLGRILGDDDAVDDGLTEVQNAFEELPPGINLEYGGAAEVFHQIGSTIEGDLARAEAIAVPATLILLIIVFGGIIAALLPLAVGVMAIFGAFGVLYLISSTTDVSIFSINLITALGLGLAIDYSLLVVNRFREELSAGRGVDGAVARTIATAGRTIAVSALTVAVSLSALLIFPLYFLRSFAYGGIGVIVVAMTASLITLPALLKLLGARLAPKRPVSTSIDNRWGRLAQWVMKRPIAVALAVTAILVAVGLPFLGVAWGVPDDRVLPAGNSAREVSEVLRAEFDSDEANAFPIVTSSGNVDDGEIASYAAVVSTLDGVNRVDAVTGRYVGGVEVVPAAADPTLARLGNGSDVWFNVVPNIEPISPAAEALIAEIRGLNPEFKAAVGGQSASLVDSKDAIFSLVPLAGIIIAVATFVLLFLMFGSILVPIKAILLNMLSLTATFGAMVWIFQTGNGSDLLGFTATGLTDTTTPILMFCVAFGLSMDYEVFLLSRMKEEYDRTGDNEQAVVAGLAKTGRIVTAAALLLSITFFAFATSGVTFIKLFGLGLGIAVLADAFIVRATLVPALMALAGGANWWAPAWMKRIHERFGISEAVDEAPAIDLRGAELSLAIPTNAEV